MSEDYRLIVQIEYPDKASSAPSSKKETEPDPSVQTSTTPNVSDETPSINVQSVLATARNPIGALASKAMGALPYAAAAVALYESAKQITGKVASIQSDLTGDVSFKMSLDNFQTRVGIALNPVSSVLSLASQQANIQVENRRIEQQRNLLGESDVNGIGRIGS